MVYTLLDIPANYSFLVYCYLSLRVSAKDRKLPRHKSTVYCLGMFPYFYNIEISTSVLFRCSYLYMFLIF